MFMTGEKKNKFAVMLKMLSMLLLWIPFIRSAHFTGTVSKKWCLTNAFPFPPHMSQRVCSLLRWVSGVNLFLSSALTESEVSFHWKMNQLSEACPPILTLFDAFDVFCLHVFRALMIERLLCFEECLQEDKKLNFVSLWDHVSVVNQVKNM